ncbi:MAG: hypothetical protein ACREYD_12555 [Casimicrobiaceae bacterium]
MKVMPESDPVCRRPGLTRRRRAWAASLWLSAGLLAAAGPCRAEWFFDVRPGVFYDDNLTRAQQPADVRGDGAASVAAAAGWFCAASGADGITLTLEANSEAYARFNGLNLLSVGGGAAYRHKFGLGREAPWVSLALDVARDDYRGDIRDGDRLDARLEFGRRFTDRFDASLGITFDRRFAKNDRPVVPGISGKVFDLRGQGVFARAAFDITERLQLGGRIAVRRGDVESTTRPNLDIFLASDAIAADPTFGGDFFAYRLRGTTTSASASLSWALSDRSSLNFSYAAARTSAYDGLDYRNRVGTLMLAFRY